MAQTATLPLFPLKTVLFPGGRLPLRIFEARYMDMVSQVMREDGAFGVCLIAAGREVGEAAVPRLMGTEARIESWDMAQPGLLHIVARGGRRFAVTDHEVQGDGLLTATVRWLPDPAAVAVPAAQGELVALLRRIVADQAEARLAPEHFDDAAWVGARLAEILPIPVEAKQALLELTDWVSRLEIIQRFLRQRGVLAGEG
ncbi:MAG: LON peptidase substrate-binding domain-containing protein [Rhodocyclaceae bacterium]|jgi:Lon protease-like protein|nr:LON peptidase substrate-binding domain-containing protein [Rhodocyclaceae bacterium]